MSGRGDALGHVVEVLFEGLPVEYERYATPGPARRHAETLRRAGLYAEVRTVSSSSSDYEADSSREADSDDDFWDFRVGEPVVLRAHAHRPYPGVLIVLARVSTDYGSGRVQYGYLCSQKGMQYADRPGHSGRDECYLAAIEVQAAPGARPE